MIKIKRDSSYADFIRSYHVVLDGKTIGKIKQGQEVFYEIPHGTHEIQLKMDWVGSKTIKFVKNENIIEFACGNNVRGKDPLLYITFKRDQYLWLERVDQ